MRAIKNQMKYTVILSITLVCTSLVGFGCGTNSGTSTSPNNKPSVANNSSVSNTTSTAASNAAGKDVPTDAIAPGSPTATVKTFHDLAAKGDADGMTKLFSEKTTQERTAAKIKEANAGFSKIAQQVVSASPNATIFNVNEAVDTDAAVVKFIYGNPASRSGPHSKCRLVKERGEWKIVAIEEDRD